MKIVTIHSVVALIWSDKQQFHLLRKNLNKWDSNQCYNSLTSLSHSTMFSSFSLSALVSRIKRRVRWAYTASVGIIFRRTADPDSLFQKTRLVFTECNASTGPVTWISQYRSCRGSRHHLWSLPFYSNCPLWTLGMAKKQPYLRRLK